ncbi:hypothetical protein N7494_009672 [Penicillium frequentans]|uniref:Uncharacterized protein n=1 Tax=Penicillium frequentans TaxID=3151616 RepID=A0AAD6GBT0_9EURO|nr:hypothetical protein N7494_009672 [Penicillium glabrum]
MASYLITGANRGLGLLMASFLASKPMSKVGIIVAAVRSTSDALDRLVKSSNGRVAVLAVQVTDEESVRKFAGEVVKVLPSGLDVLINNAGIMQYSPDAELGVETMYVGEWPVLASLDWIPSQWELTTCRNNLHDHWSINLNSVHLVSRALLPLLRTGKKKTIVNLSSTLGSIALARQYMFQPTPAYKISKAALNMLTVQYAAYLEKEGFIIFGIDPGWARTEMGSEHADLDPEEAAVCLISKVLDATKEDSGKFFEANVPSWEYKGGPNRYEGQILPW